MLPEDMSVKESHDIALMLQHKVGVRSPYPHCQTCEKRAHDVCLIRVMYYTYPFALSHRIYCMN